MTLRHFVTFLALLSLLLGGCSKQSAPPGNLSPGAPILKVSVFADGRLTVDGSEATIESLRAALYTVSKQHGGVCYYREASQQEPPPIAEEVMKAIVEARLPIRFSSRPDYSDSIGFADKPAAVRVVFDVAEVALIPGRQWTESRSELYASSRNTCLPVLKGAGEFKGVMIFVAADPADRCPPEERAAGLRGDYAANPEIVSGSLKEEKFTTDAGLAGVHLAYDRQREADGKKVKGHSSTYIVQNARGVTVALFVIASGVGHEPTDLAATDQMIRKTLHLASRPDYSAAIGVAKRPMATKHIPDTDPEMAAAIVRAQETLPEFWQAYDTRAHGESDFLLVVRITEKGRNERFVITDFERRGGKTIVTIRSDPKIVSSVKRGDRIEIPAADITDWRYVRDGKEVGFRTVKVLLKHMPADQVQALKKL